MIQSELRLRAHLLDPSNQLDSGDPLVPAEGRAQSSHGRGHRFESGIAHHPSHKSPGFPGLLSFQDECSCA